MCTNCLIYILNDIINIQFVVVGVHLTFCLIRSGYFLWGKMCNVRPFDVKVIDVWCCGYILGFFFFCQCEC